MSKLAALLSNDEVAENATDQLAKLRIEDLTWELLREEDEMERILPAMVWPTGNTAQGAGVGGPLGAAVQTTYPGDNALEDRGADDNVADFYAQSIAHGATAIVVDTPDSHRDQVHRILEAAGATRITWES